MNNFILENSKSSLPTEVAIVAIATKLFNIVFMLRDVSKTFKLIHQSWSIYM